MKRMSIMLWLIKSPTNCEWIRPEICTNTYTERNVEIDIVLLKCTFCIVMVLSQFLFLSYFKGTTNNSVSKCTKLSYFCLVQKCNFRVRVVQLVFFKKWIFLYIYQTIKVHTCTCRQLHVKEMMNDLFWIYLFLKYSFLFIHYVLFIITI